jgi:hypothetical protein
LLDLCPKDCLPSKMQSALLPKHFGRWTSGK